MLLLPTSPKTGRRRVSVRSTCIRQLRFAWWGILAHVRLPHRRSCASFEVISASNHGEGIGFCAVDAAYGLKLSVRSNT